MCLCEIELHHGTPGSGVAIVCVYVHACGVWDNGGSGAGPGTDCVWWTCGARDFSLC